MCEPKNVKTVAVYTRERIMRLDELGQTIV